MWVMTLLPYTVPTIHSIALHEPQLLREVTKSNFQFTAATPICFCKYFWAHGGQWSGSHVWCDLAPSKHTESIVLGASTEDNVGNGSSK